MRRMTRSLLAVAIGTGVVAAGAGGCASKTGTGALIAQLTAGLALVIIRKSGKRGQIQLIEDFIVICLRDNEAADAALGVAKL